MTIYQNLTIQVVGEVTLHEREISFEPKDGDEQLVVGVDVEGQGGGAQQEDHATIIRSGVGLILEK